MAKNNTDITASNTDGKYILQSVDTAFQVLDLFFKYEELSAAEVARILDTTRTTAFRFLVTLENTGYLNKTKNSKYRLSSKISSLGQIAANRMELINLVHPYLEKITKETGESTHLATINDGIHVSFIDKAVGTLLLKMDVPIGHTQLIHLTGTGKAILAFESDQIINNYIKNVEFTQLTSRSAGSAMELLKDFDTIRENGFAVDNEESEIGLYCIAVPIMTTGNKPVGAISASGPTTRMIARQDIFIDKLKNAANQISHSLGNQQ